MKPGSIEMQAAIQRMELYFMTHPGSPSAVQRPRLSVRGKVWTALLGPNPREGIAGFGPTVEAALSDFDAQYLRALRPPEPAGENQRQSARGNFLSAGDSKCAYHPIFSGGHSRVKSSS